MYPIADVRFNVHAAVGGDRRMATYLDGEPDEEKARAKAGALWEGGASRVELTMDVRYVIGRQTAPPRD